MQVARVAEVIFIKYAMELWVFTIGGVHYRSFSV